MPFHLYFYTLLPTLKKENTKTSFLLEWNLSQRNKLTADYHLLMQFFLFTLKLIYLHMKGFHSKRK